MFNFAIIEFTKSKSVGIIPWSWMKSNDLTKCYYPPERLYKKVLSSLPNLKWKIYDCRILTGAGNYFILVVVTIQILIF